MLISQSPYKLSMEENIRWLLEPQPSLDARLFGQDNQLLVPVQQQLLNVANILINECVAPFPWFEVEDIVLCGSADSYHYTQYSDIDMKIILRRKKENNLFANDSTAYRFMSKVVNAYYQKRAPFCVNKRLIDLRVAFYLRQRQLYSILRRQWIVEPSRTLMEGLNADEIVAEAQKILRQIKYMREEQFEHPNGKYQVEDLWQMQRFYNQLVAMKSTSVFNLLVNKLLNYGGHLHGMKNFCRREIVRVLSF